MELTGKVIIFDNEDEAKIWFESIQEVLLIGKVESLKGTMDYLEQRRKDEVNVNKKFE